MSKDHVDNLLQDIQALQTQIACSDLTRKSIGYPPIMLVTTARFSNWGSQKPRSLRDPRNRVGSQGLFGGAHESSEIILGNVHLARPFLQGLVTRNDTLL